MCNIWSLFSFSASSASPSSQLSSVERLSASTHTSTVAYWMFQFSFVFFFFLGLLFFASSHILEISFELIVIIAYLSNVPPLLLSSGQARAQEDPRAFRITKEFLLKRGKRKICMRANKQRRQEFTRWLLWADKDIMKITFLELQCLRSYAAFKISTFFAQESSGCLLMAVLA